MSPANLEWWYPLGGGLLIGLSAGLYLLFNGRVTGISGMASVALDLSRAGSSSLAYAIRRRMATPILASNFEVPAGRTIDRRLMTGAALFGVGWGVVGLCPGPAIAALTTGRQLRRRNRHEAVRSSGRGHTVQMRVGVQEKSPYFE